eukprot:CAMPEP_0183316946 /NCGR_PEP_ID=MMETSP0160_2-20130417/56582_1 /TAXON_ID=2839 ORGANISM="Odontella Sinensis, Strain Grunow 1884" /NCGR_SAMPLE_ID=MMETSP0160_2 /ASSEMBLY_ACC=CAM_ASM_000250 /LENGTH=384 /DNA_ID=CAMNT_0025482857 /DNA_START=38 /DNA_END=1189 /DNA_ORIENTATION=+
MQAPEIFDHNLEEQLLCLEKERDEAIRDADALREQVKAMNDATLLIARVLVAPQRRSLRSSFSSHAPALNGLDEDNIMFDQMQKNWKFENTGFPGLFAKCKMVRENLRLISSEADDALDEMHSAISVSKEANERLVSTTTALQKLWKENKILRKEKKDLIKVIKHMKNQQSKELCEAQAKQTKEMDEFLAVMAHEQTMLSKATSFDSDDNSSSQSSPDRPQPVSEDESIFTAKSNGNPTIQIKEVKMLPGDILSRQMNKEDQRRDIYTITFSNNKEIGLKLHTMPMQPKVGEGKMMSTSTQRKQAGLFMKRQAEAFIVCGFRDIDVCCQKRPTVGARLVAVGGVTVENRNFSLKEVCGQIRARKGAITLSFRNDPLTEDQIDYL